VNVESTSDTRRPDKSVVMHLILLLVFGFVTWAVYFIAPQPFAANGGDNIWYLPTAMSLAHRGTLDLSPFRADLAKQKPWDVWINVMDADPRITRVSGRQMNRFPIGPSLLALPLVPLLEPRLAAVQSPMRRADHLAAIAAASTATVSVLMVMVLIYMLTKSWPLTWSLGLFHAFASPHFSTHHSAFWSHNAVQPMILLALILLVAREGRYVWLAALPLVLAYATRPDASILIAAYSVCVLLLFRAASVRYLVLLGAGMGAFFYWSYSIYGTWRPPYYGLIPGTPIFSPAALFGMLFSPNRGLFVFTPAYLICVAGALLAWFHRRRYSVIYLLAAVVVAGQWLVIAVLDPLWWGGFSYGPRLFCPVLPLLTILMIPALEEIRPRSESTVRMLRVLVGLALLWCLFVQVRGSFASGPHEWNYNPNVDLHREQLWNWSDMQIFR
jgi:hypothetical protein